MKNRTVLKEIKEGQFEEIQFSELKESDRFKMKEPNGELVKDLEGNSLFTCTSDTYLNKKDTYTVNVT